MKPELKGRVICEVIAVAVLAGVMLIAAAGCDTSRLVHGVDENLAAWNTKLGVTRLTSGQMGLRVLTCSTERVRRVTLALDDPQSTTGGPVLWRILANGHETTSEFVIGAATPGFETATSLRRNPSSRQPLALFVDTTDRYGNYLIEFRGRDALPGKIYLDGPSLLGSNVHVTPKEFAAQNMRVCAILKNGPPRG